MIKPVLYFSRVYRFNPLSTPAKERRNGTAQWLGLIYAPAGADAAGDAQGTENAESSGESAEQNNPEAHRNLAQRWLFV